MSESNELYACTKCFTRHPFQELSRGSMMCKTCRIAFPIVKCTYCRSEFQQTQKNSTKTICSKCESNEKQFGKPTVCGYCNIISAFIGNKCQRCTYSERKYGSPVTCEQCKQKCAFDRKEEDKKVEGKLLCWLCTISFKRALAKSQRSTEKTKYKITSKNNERTHPYYHKHPPSRVDVTKVIQSSKEETVKNNSPGTAKIPRLHNEFMESGSDHFIVITELTEKYTALERQLQIKENQLIEKEKYITELKAEHFRKEEEHRNMMINKKKEYEREIDSLHSKIKAMQREIASLNKKLSNKNSGNSFNMNNNTNLLLNDSVSSSYNINGKDSNITINHTSQNENIEKSAISSPISN